MCTPVHHAAATSAPASPFVTSPSLFAAQHSSATGFSSGAIFGSSSSAGVSAIASFAPPPQFVFGSSAASSVQPAPVARKSLDAMTSSDVAAEVAKVDGCKKYELAWSCSDIDGLNVIGCNEEELNEWLVDIDGLSENADHRKAILQHLNVMRLKSQASAGI